MGYRLTETLLTDRPLEADKVQRYAWCHDLSSTPQGAGGVGGLLAVADAASGRSWCYAYDGNGNVSAVVDLADGTKVGRYEYDAFGQTIASSGDEELAEVNAYRFSTKPVEGTGLYYYGFRWYEAQSGRWLGRDPIAERGGVNLYAFVENNPQTRIDVLGTITIASKIDAIVAGRLIWSLSPSGQVGNRYFKTEYALNDDENEMPGLIEEELQETYEAWLEENAPISSDWAHKTFSFNAAAKEAFTARSHGIRSTGWWLNSSKIVRVDADVHVRCEGANYVMRINRASWIWEDIINANPYPNEPFWGSPMHWLENTVNSTLQPFTRFDFAVKIDFSESSRKIVSVPK